MQAWVSPAGPWSSEELKGSVQGVVREDGGHTLGPPCGRPHLQPRAPRWLQMPQPTL